MVAIAVIGAAPVAHADADPGPTLTGEDATMAGTGTLTCASATSGSGSYDVVGEAVGPYPGLMEESATFTFDAGSVTSYHASFTIHSAAGDITGTKDFSNVSAGMSCSTDLQALTGNLVARYTATIPSPTSPTPLVDHGVSPVSVILTTDLLGTHASVGTQFSSDREDSLLGLTPFEATNPVGTTHTVTAILSDGLALPIANATVLFTVEGSVTTTGACVTGGDGRCNFTYSGPATSGADLITGCYDFDDDGAVDPGERCANATKAWEEQTGAPGSASGGGYFFDTLTGNRVVFGFSAHDNPQGPNGQCNVHDVTAGVKVKCLNVALLVITGTHAHVTGEALQNGTATNYTIDVDDLGNPGAGNDTFTIQTDSGYVASGVVDNGNIRVTPG